MEIFPYTALEMDNFASIYSLFQECQTPEMRYQKIIELGGKLPCMKEELKTKENLVLGCQSIVYLHAELKNEKFYYTASSDALISAGLAHLLILAYQEKSPEFVIKQHPIFLEKLGITASLSPGRSNGLASMYLRMQKTALNFLVRG